MAAPRIRTVARALPPHFADQETLIAALRDEWAGKHFNVERLEDLHRAVGVDGRHLAVPVEQYRGLTTFRARNDAWTAAALDLGAQAVSAALHVAGLAPTDIDHLCFVTVTGLATPSIDARLVNRLGFRPDVTRAPLFGLGCVGGVAGTARVSDVLRAWPGRRALLLTVELCSLTLQREDLSVANIIASGLFGDGAAALLMEGGDLAGEGPEVVATASVFYPDTERMMGWDFVDTGFKLVLSAAVPDLVRNHVRSDVDNFLRANGLTRSDITHWVAHTGGPKVLKAFEEALELPAAALERSWRSLRDVGNLSSASVLFVLSELLASGEARRGDLGLMMAMGPGFCAELVLLRW
ncbi:MAG TPA: 3-oxoacyl-[acyl-carrier-protein] synthase III C-terminal domain-containing protein [Gemmatimonadaceae bacterium]